MSYVPGFKEVPDIPRKGRPPKWEIEAMKQKLADELKASGDKTRPVE